MLSAPIQLFHLKERKGPCTIPDAQLRALEPGVRAGEGKQVQMGRFTPP